MKIKIIIIIALLAFIGCKKEPLPKPNLNLWKIEVISFSERPIQYQANQTTKVIKEEFSQELIANTDLNMGVTILNPAKTDNFQLIIRYNDSIVENKLTNMFYSLVKIPK